MNNQEAIASLKTLCHTCDLFPKCVHEKPECFQAIEMAISALEKQIPKKPNKIQSKNSENLWNLYCPSCENWIGMWNSRLKLGDMHNISNGKICPYCGQAIDWEDER